MYIYIRTKIFIYIRVKIVLVLSLTDLYIYIYLDQFQSTVEALIKYLYWENNSYPLIRQRCVPFSKSNGASGENNMSINQRCLLFRLFVHQRFYCICQFSILPCLDRRSEQFFQSLFFACLCRSQNSFIFLIWWIVIEMELEKCRTILPIRGQICSLPTRSHTHFHYICKTPHTCLLLPNHSEMRSQQFGNLSPRVPSNPPTLPQLSSKTSRGIGKNIYLSPLKNSCFFIFF